jgi:pyruvate/2-oxoglutarate dehydrogenase complex dihydrolipoamide dehydrogenase (E3) component
LSEAGRARLLAASRVEWTVDFSKIAKRVLWMARDLNDSRPAAAMEATGARLFRGEGRLTDLHTGELGREQLVARRAVIIANGSTAAIPPIPGLILGTIEFWTNRQAAIPRDLPASLAILGGGAIGIELGQAFARLGLKVTVIEAGPTFLGLEEPEAGAALPPHLGPQPLARPTTMHARPNVSARLPSPVVVQALGDSKRSWQIQVPVRHVLSAT